MNATQKTIKYIALAFAVLLCVGIIGGLINAFTSISWFLEGDKAAGGMKTYNITGEIKRLDIEVGASRFIIKTGDTFRAESNNKYLTVEEKDGVLKIRDKKGLRFNYSGDIVLELYIPDGTVFEKAEISFGAGRVEIECLSAENLNLELGAGEVVIDNLVAQSNAKINGGAGKITIGGGRLANLELDMGIGQMNLTSKLTGNCKLEFGVGAAKLKLIGTSEDYKISVSKGIGEVTVDGEKVSDGATRGEGANRVKVEGGIGAIKISFENE